MEKIKKIDIHAHAIPWPEYTPKYAKYNSTMLTPTELFEEYYNKLNIEKCVLLPCVSPEAALSCATNEITKFLVDQNPDKLLWFCNVDPRAINNSENSNLGYLLEHYMSLGGEDTVALGCDFDGTDYLPDGLQSVSDMPALAEALARLNYSDTQIDKIFYANAKNFIDKNL